MQKLSLRSRGWRPARTMNAPDAGAPWLARSNAARSSSGDVQHFNPLVNSLVNPPSRSSWAAAKPLQPLSPRSGALIALARSGAVRTPFGAEAAPHRATIAICHLSPLLCSHGCAHIARERPGWILVCLLGHLLQREQDHRSVDRIVPVACHITPT